MGWQGDGTFRRTDGTRTGTQVWQDARDAGVNIRADDHDTHDEDIADGLENTVALDGQNTTTTDNAILRYDTGQTAFTGASIGASEIVGRSATGDVRGLSNTTARQVLGVASADSPNFGGVSISAQQYGWLGGLGSAPLEDDDLAANGGTVPEEDRLISSKNTSQGLQFGTYGFVASDSGNSPTELILDSNRASTNQTLGLIAGLWNGNRVSQIVLGSGADSTNKDDGRVEFGTSESGGSPQTRMEIYPNGGVTVGSPSGGSQGAGTLNGELYDEGNRVAIQPGSSSDPGLAFDTWRTPNASRATFVSVSANADNNGVSTNIVHAQVDESGGTSFDYQLEIVRSDVDEPSGTSQRFGSLSFIVPAGAAYRIEADTNNSGTAITTHREFTL